MFLFSPLAFSESDILIVRIDSENFWKEIIHYIIIFTSRKRSLRRLCFYTCLSVILFTVGRGWYPSMHCRWYPSIPCRSPRGVVSCHALQVSRPTPKGNFRGLAWGGFPGPHPGGEVEGSGLGVLQAHTQGRSPGPHPGGSPGPHPGGFQARHPPSRWPLLQMARTLLECILLFLMLLRYRTEGLDIY